MLYSTSWSKLSLFVRSCKSASSFVMTRAFNTCDRFACATLACSHDRRVRSRSCPPVANAGIFGCSSRQDGSTTWRISSRHVCYDLQQPQHSAVFNHHSCKLVIYTFKQNAQKHLQRSYIIINNVVFGVLKHREIYLKQIRSMKRVSAQYCCIPYTVMKIFDVQL